MENMTIQKHEAQNNLESYETILHIVMHSLTIW